MIGENKLKMLMIGGGKQLASDDLISRLSVSSCKESSFKDAKTISAKDDQQLVPNTGMDTCK